jgi:hypothetical protein
MMTHNVTTVQDSLSPEILAELAQSFGLELQASDYITDGDLIYDEIERMVGLTSGEYLWDAMWRFGIVVDDDVARQRSCGDLWRPDGHIASGYYVPDDYDTEVSLITLDDSVAVEEAA